MKTGDMVTVVKCDVCPSVVGKTVAVKRVEEGARTAELNFGKGRPPKGRPGVFSFDDLSLVVEKD